MYIQRVGGDPELCKQWVTPVFRCQCRWRSVCLNALGVELQSGENTTNLALEPFRINMASSRLNQGAKETAALRGP